MAVSGFWWLAPMRQGHMRMRPGIALRAFWHAVVRRHHGELCFDCGRPYLLWYADDDEMYRSVYCRDGGGLICPGCFDRRARRLGLILQWMPQRFGAA